jgi:DnaD/phage-associated family protein
MMAKQTSGFIGFPDKKMKRVVIPDHFFSDLLPQIDDLAELKLILHCLWLLNEQSGELRYLRGDDLRQDPQLLHSLAPDSDLRSPQAVLQDALERAVARNVLLRLEITIETDGAMRVQGDAGGASGEEAAADEASPAEPASDTAVVEDWYFINTAKGRETLAKIRQGRLQEVLAVIPAEARLYVERPNIFVMYEQNLGVMTPLIADQLRDMEKNYPPAWIEEAFDAAVSRNARNLKYIQAILKRWETEGKDPATHEARNYEKPERDSGKRRSKKYTIPDEYSDIIIGS